MTGALDTIERLAGNLLTNLHLGAAFAAFMIVDALAQRRLKLLGYEPASVTALTFWLGAGAMVGARLVYLLPRGTYLLNHPVDILFINAGLSWYGALAGAGAALYLFGRRHAIPRLAIADAYALFLPLGIALYRLTCFAHSACWGVATDSFLGVRFSGLSVARYPSELYEGILVLGLFAALLQASRRNLRVGILSAAFFVGYAVIRGLTDLIRIQAGFWSTADPWLAVAMGLAGAAILLMTTRRALPVSSAA
ncbi:MAG: prolipoprotein diacylglyceryl transferase, partial [Chloroflexi bacterium]|nr:prolipoprotein diacylglyceryl transferase [Chloroflexota bacterium]